MTELVELLKPIWRVILAMLIAQMVGSFLGAYFNIKSEPRLSLWHGGALAMPLGYAIGLAWHLWKVPDGFAPNRSLLLFLGFASISFPIFGLFIPDSTAR